MSDKANITNSTKKELYKGEKFSKYTFWLFGILLFTVFIAAFILYLNLRKNLTNEAQQNLKEISIQKSNQVDHWFQNQHKIADFFYGNQILTNKIIEFFKNPDNKTIRSDLKQWFSQICEKFNYSSLRLVDTDANLLISNKDGARIPGALIRDVIKELNSSRKIYLTDFHFYDKTDTIHSDLIIPIISSDNQKLYGFLCLEINPNDFLFPLIQQWPTNTSSAECLLVKNDNGDALFLNNLRFLNKTALKYKIDKSRTDIICIKAINGARGLVSGKDYREVRALSYIQEIQGTDWILIVKIDEAEIYEGVNASAALFGFMLFVTISLVGWIIISNYKRIERINQDDKIKLEQEKQYLSAHYYMFIENTNDIIILSDLSGNIKEINNKALKAYGYSVDEFLNMNIREICSENLRHSRKVRETLHRKKDGSTFPVEISSKAITLNDEIYIQNFIRDISERAQAQKRIYHLNSVYSILSQISQSIVRIKDRNELFEKCVDIAIEYGNFDAAWIGIRENDTGKIKPLYLKGIGISEFYEVMKNMIYNYAHRGNPVKKAVETKMPVICNNLRNEVQEDKIKFYIERRNYRSEVSIPLIFKNEVIGTFNILHCEEDNFTDEEMSLMEEIKNDISYALEMMQVEKERKAAQEEVQRSENRFKTIFENASDSVIIVQGNKIIDLNIQTEYLLGYTREELIDKNIYSLAMDIDVRKISLKQILNRAKEGIPQRFLWRIRKKNGTDIQADISLNTITVGSVTMAILVIRDITERMKIEEELIKAKNHAEEMSQLKTHFLANMSHEIRTPLNGILGFSEILIEHSKDDESKNISSIILNSGRRLLETLNNILDLAKIEAEKVVTRKEKIKLSEVIDEILKVYKSDADVKNLNLKFDILCDTYSLLDKDLLSHILSNLINNAVTYTNQGSVTVTLNEISINDEKFSEIKISDTGIGINKESFNMIFEPFRQVSEGYGRHYEGTGLGLTISKKYTTLMNGTIEVESKEGQGSTFILKFPAIKSSDYSNDVRVSDTDDFEQKPKRLINVLIVEDDEYSLNYARTVLRNLCIIDEVYLGQDAIDKAKLKFYDLILMDIGLSDMSGLDAIKEIRRSGLNPDVTITAVTAFAFQNDKENLLNCGCDYYLAKPYKFEELQNIVKCSVSKHVS